MGYLSGNGSENDDYEPQETSEIGHMLGLNNVDWRYCRLSLWYLPAA